MAIILDAQYNYANERFQMAKSTRDNDEIGYLADMMIGNELLRSAEVLAKSEMRDPKAQKIFNLLVNQAAILPLNQICGEEDSFLEFGPRLSILKKQLPEMPCGEGLEQLKKMQQKKVYPRNFDEIKQLIQYKKELQSYYTLFDVCSDIEKAYNEKPTEGQVKRMREKLKKSIQNLNLGFPFLAVEEASKKLVNMESAIPKRSFFSNLSQPPATPSSSSSSSSVRPGAETVSRPKIRMWVKIGAAAALVAVCAILYKRVYP